jgi:hypothetical protein
MLARTEVYSGSGFVIGEMMIHMAKEDEKPYVITTSSQGENFITVRSIRGGAMRFEQLATGGYRAVLPATGRHFDSLEAVCTNVEEAGFTHVSKLHFSYQRIMERVFLPHCVNVASAKVGSGLLHRTIPATDLFLKYCHNHGLDLNGRLVPTLLRDPDHLVVYQVLPDGLTCQEVLFSPIEMDRGSLQCARCDFVVDGNMYPAMPCTKPNSLQEIANMFDVKGKMVSRELVIGWKDDERRNSSEVALAIMGFKRYQKTHIFLAGVPIEIIRLIGKMVVFALR